MFHQAFVHLFIATNAYGLGTPKNAVQAVQGAIIVVKAMTPLASSHPPKPLTLVDSSVTNLTSPPIANDKNEISNGTSRKSWPQKIFHSVIFINIKK
jgi:hypothetical protein